jgi:outer membrane protein assembly factor BamB
VKLTVKGKTASVEEVWYAKELANHHGGVMLVDGYVYGSTSNWVCLDWKTGEVKWDVEGVGKGCVTMADGLLYTMSEKKKVGLAKPSPKGHELISQFELPEQGEGPCWAHPVVCDGRLYIRYDGFLYAYDVKGK